MTKQQVLIIGLLILAYSLSSFFLFNPIPVAVKLFFFGTLIVQLISLEKIGHFTLSLTELAQFSPEVRWQRVFLSFFWTIAFLFYSHSTKLTRFFDQDVVSLVSLALFYWLARVKSSFFYCLAALMIFLVPLFFLTTHPITANRLSTLAYLLIILAWLKSIIELKYHHKEVK